MPIYEYECTDCGKPFEKMVRFSEADKEQTCPTCQGRNTRKKISTFASLGGSGGDGGSSTGSSCGSSGGFT
jgi:putative FmdB family regulatory protein